MAAWQVAAAIRETTERLSPAVAAAVPLISSAAPLFEHARRATDGVATLVDNGVAMSREAMPTIHTIAATLNETEKLMRRVAALAAHPVLRLSLGENV